LQPSLRPHIQSGKSSSARLISDSRNKGQRLLVAFAYSSSMAVGRVVDVSVRMLYVLELKVRVLQGGAELATVVGIPDTNNG
jgi:hypothetical protein